MGIYMYVYAHCPSPLCVCNIDLIISPLFTASVMNPSADSYFVVSRISWFPGISTTPGVPEKSCPVQRIRLEGKLE